MDDSRNAPAAAKSEKKTESTVPDNKGGEPDKSDTAVKKDSSISKVPVCVLIPSSPSTTLFLKFYCAL